MRSGSRTSLGAAEADDRAAKEARIHRVGEKREAQKAAEFLPQQHSRGSASSIDLANELQAAFSNPHQIWPYFFGQRAGQKIDITNCNKC